MSKDAEQILIDKYLKKLPEKIVNLQNAVNTKDALNTQSQLHKLAGSAGMYGLVSVSSLAAQLEDVIVSGKALDSPNFQTLFEALCAKVNES